MARGLEGYTHLGHVRRRVGGERTNAADVRHVPDDDHRGVGTPRGGGGGQHLLQQPGRGREFVHVPKAGHACIHPR